MNFLWKSFEIFHFLADIVVERRILIKKGSRFICLLFNALTNKLYVILRN